MKQDVIIPRLTELHMLVYQVFRVIDPLEQELYQRQLLDEYRSEPQSSQLYGARQAVQSLKDLGWALAQRWNKQELAYWLHQKYDEWETALTWYREVAANPYAKGRSEIARYQAEGWLPLYEQWRPTLEWLASPDRTKLPQHREMRKRFARPRPVEEERQRAIQLDAAVMAIYEDANSYFMDVREYQEGLDAVQYGEMRGHEIIRNYLSNWRGTIPILDALQQRIQDLLAAYRSHMQSCQELMDCYEQDVAKWERDNWCCYYRGPGEQPTEIERVRYRAIFRREYGPEKQSAEIAIVQGFINKLETALCESGWAQRLDTSV